MLDESTQLLGAQIASGKDGTPLTFITGLKYDTNVVKALNNLTFLYDPNWEYESLNPTYPIAFFYVKKQTEEMASEISQKPMLFYDSASESGKDSVRAGLTNIVADNIIIKPKVYKLDVLIPMNMNTFFSGGYFHVGNVASANAFMFSSGANQGSKQLSSVMDFASKTMGILKTLFNAIYGSEMSANSVFTMLCSQQDYNKNSIEYMWRNRRILKLKIWNGWQFKYLAITNFEVTKEGESGTFFEGTITCQELPIITLKSEAGALKTKMTASHVRIGNGIKTVTEKFVNTMETTHGVLQ